MGMYMVAGLHTSNSVGDGEKTHTLVWGDGGQARTKGQLARNGRGAALALRVLTISVGTLPFSDVQMFAT